MGEHSANGQGGGLLDRVIADYLEAVEAGQTPDPAEWLARYSSVAEELLQFFVDRDQLLRWTEPLRQAVAGETSPAVPLGGAAGKARPLPAALGGYELLALLGRGGMGEVYKARQQSPNRLVALKVIRPDRPLTSADLQRFRNEAELVAQLDHPHIVPVYEVGESQGQLYFTMKFVQGGTLADRLKPADGGLRPAVQLVAAVARAVHHAHQRGVLHRDLKPTNILIDQEGRPLVADFGLAKRLGGAAELTRTDGPVGSPPYMAPEQTGGRGPVTTGADVYGLGAVLYALLTGRPPFRGETPLETLALVRECEPEPPGRLNAAVGRDLETICLKCLQKDPARRYGSAAALAEDLERWGRGEPIAARPARRLERAWRWCRRRPARAAAAGTAALAAVLLAAVFLAWGLDAQRRAEESEQARLRTQEQLAERQYDHALVQCARGETGLGLLWMARSLETAPAAAHDLAASLREGLAAWQCQVPRLMDCRALDQDILALDADGRTAWAAGPDGILLRIDVATGRRVGPVLQPPDRVAALAASNDGKLVVTAGGAAVCLWDAATGWLLKQFPRPETRFQAVTFSQDGKTVVTAEVAKTGPSMTTLRRWDVASGEQVGTPLGHDRQVGALALSPDGQTLLAAALQTGGITSWDMGTGKSKPFPVSRGVYLSLDYSPDGNRVLTGCKDQTARLWDPGTGQSASPALFHNGPVVRVRFGGDGRSFVSVDQKRAVRMWAVAPGPTPTVLVHNEPVLAVALSPDGKWAATGGSKKFARLWRLGPNPTVVHKLAHALPVMGVQFSPDSQTLVTREFHQTVRCWDTATGQPRANPPPHERRVISGVALSPDGRLAASASHDGTAQVWKVATGAPVATLKHGAEVTAVAFSPTGDRIVTGGTDGTARLWNARSGQPLGEPLVHGAWVWVVAFHPRGELVLTAGKDGTARLWDAATRQPAGDLMRHGGAIGTAAFSPDGRCLATGSWDGTARLWDSRTGRPLGQPLAQANEIWSLAISPDGRRLVTGSWDGTARLWDIATSRPHGPPLPHGAKIRSVAFAQDSRAVLTACDDRRARYWVVAEALPGTVAEVVSAVQVHTGMELDDEGGMRVLDPEAWRARRDRLEPRKNVPEH